jgi:thiol-disulfide isomerase/thioredoxin
VKTTAAIAQIGFIAVAAVSVYTFVGAAQKDMRRASCNALCKLAPSYAGSDRVAPDFELPDMNGKPVRLSSFRGKVVFLNFWTKTCGPCLEEMPSLVELARIAKGRKDFVVITVSTDEGPNEVRDALKVAIGGAGEVPFPVLFDPESKVVREKYGTRLFPETWVIDPAGVIRARFDGARDWSTPLAVEVGNMAGTQGACPVEFFKSQPRGPFAGLCEDET